MNKCRKEKSYKAFEYTGVFVFINLSLLYIGGRNGKPLLKKYSEQPLKAILISLGLTSAFYIYYFFIWIPFKNWFIKTWS